MLDSAALVTPAPESPQARFAALKAGLDVRMAGGAVAAQKALFASGLPELDQALRGGLPRGALTTLEGPPTSGRTALLAALLARATAGGYAAYVDEGALYPPDFERAGVVLERLLVVHAAESTAAARCCDALLRSRAFALVAMPAFPLRGVVWSRLCGLTHKGGTVLIALGMQAAPELASFAATRLRCGIERVRWDGGSALFCELAGYELRATVLKARRGAPGAVARLCISEHAKIL